MLLVAVLAAALAAPAAGPPTLAVVTMDPLTVHGVGFHARERVRTDLRVGDERLTQRVRAGRRGGFTVRFPSATGVDRCSAYTVKAVGASGDRGVVRHLPAPGCAPA